MARAIVRMILVLHLVSSVLSVHRGPLTPRPTLSNDVNSLQAKMVSGLSKEQAATYLKRDMLVGKRSAELVDGDWFQDRPPPSFTKRRPKSYESTKRVIANNERDLQLLNRPMQTTSHIWNRITTLAGPTVATDVTVLKSKNEISSYATGVAEPKGQNGISSYDVITVAFPVTEDTTGYDWNRVSSNALPDHTDAGRRQEDNRSDVIPLPLPVNDRFAGSGRGSPVNTGESTPLAALLRMIWYVRNIDASHGKDDSANVTPRRLEHDHDLQDYMKRAYVPYASREMLRKRPFDSLANGLIGKRSVSSNDHFRKRPFDSLANGLMGKLGGRSQDNAIHRTRSLDPFGKHETQSEGY